MMCRWWTDWLFLHDHKSCGQAHDACRSASGWRWLALKKQWRLCPALSHMNNRRFRRGFPEATCPIKFQCPSAGGRVVVITRCLTWKSMKRRAVSSCNPLQDEIQNDEREKNCFDLANILCARLVPWLRVGNIFHRVYDVVERQTNNFSCGVFCAANLFFDCLVDPSLRYSLAWIL